MSDDGRKFYEHAHVAFQRLKVKPGEVIVIRLPADISYEQMKRIAVLTEDVREETGCVVILTTDGITVEHLDEEKMNKLGWYKFDKDKIN